MPFAVGTLKRSGKNQLSTSFETWLVVLYTNCKAIGQSLSSSKTKVRILFLPLLKLNFVYWLLYFSNYLEGHESMFSHLNFVCCIKLPLTHVNIQSLSIYAKWKGHFLQHALPYGHKYSESMLILPLARKCELAHRVTFLRRSNSRTEEHVLTECNGYHNIRLKLSDNL